MTHPSWCSPDRCTVTPQTPHGSHVSERRTIVDAYGPRATVRLIQGVTGRQPVTLVDIVDTRGPEDCAIVLDLTSASLLAIQTLVLVDEAERAEGTQ